MEQTITGIYPIDKEKERGENGVWELKFFNKHFEAKIYHEYQREDEVKGWVDMTADLFTVIKYSDINRLTMLWNNQFEYWSIEIAISGTDGIIYLFFEEDKKPIEFFNQLKEKYLNA